MGRTQKAKDTSRRVTKRPAKTPEERENRLVSLAMELAEKQIREGTASAQVVSHFLKLGTVREQMEREKLSNETKLLQAKAEQIATTQRSEELYAQAIAALKKYKGEEEHE